ncbi:MAG: VOC family protein [Acidimicrobiia bacterium]
MTATIQPVLHYRDLPKAIAFLEEAFGFVEHAMHRGPDGELAYAELTLDGCTIGAGPRADGSPFDLGPSAVYAAIDDPDTFHDRALAAGAEIVMGLTDQEYGSREFAARDTEGNVWCFGTYRPAA